MENDSNFVDYYGVLQTKHDCTQRQLEHAYHYFAKLYHPDSGESSDVEKFNEVTEAYRILRDPEKRAQFDKRYFRETGTRPRKVDTFLDDSLDTQEALDDADAHARILFQLYKRRREYPSDPGILGWTLKEGLGCSENQFDFHTWYLKSKGLVQITEQGTIAITIEGVDHVIASSRAVQEKRLFIEHSSADSYHPTPGPDRADKDM